jgi:hypothetical protein
LKAERLDLKAVRHASLMAHGRYVKAEAVYREAHATHQRFTAAWARADNSITSSCLCQPGT